jgi:hypothetical protein
LGIKVSGPQFDAMARLSGGIVSAVLRLVYHLHPTFVA